MPLNEVVCGWPRPAGMRVPREEIGAAARHRARLLCTHPAPSLHPHPSEGRDARVMLWVTLREFLALN